MFEYRAVRALARGAGGVGGVVNPLLRPDADAAGGEMQCRVSRTARWKTNRLVFPPAFRVPHERQREKCSITLIVYSQNTLPGFSNFICFSSCFLFPHFMFTAQGLVFIRAETLSPRVAQWETDVALDAVFCGFLFTLPPRSSGLQHAKITVMSKCLKTIIY